MKKYNNFYEVELSNDTILKVNGQNIREVKNLVRKMSISATRIRRVCKNGTYKKWENF